MTYLPPVVTDRLVSELGKYKDGKPFDPEDVVSRSLDEVFGDEERRQYSILGWIEALSIFAKYQDADGYFSTAAEHDVIYAGPPADLVSAKDIARLDALGWNIDKENGGFYYFT